MAYTHTSYIGRYLISIICACAIRVHFDVMLCAYIRRRMCIYKYIVSWRVGVRVYDLPCVYEWLCAHCQESPLTVQLRTWKKTFLFSSLRPIKRTFLPSLIINFKKIDIIHLQFTWFSILTINRYKFKNKNWCKQKLNAHLSDGLNWKYFWVIIRQYLKYK